MGLPKSRSRPRSAADPVATLRKRLQRFRERAILVLVIHPAELAEFSVGLISLTAGLALTLEGNPAARVPWHATGGGILLAAFGLPQMIAAIHGQLRWRHISNVFGCTAALANFLRASYSDIHVAAAFFAAIFALCFWFWMRTAVQRFLQGSQESLRPYCGAK